MWDIIENIEKDIEFHKHFPDEEWALILDGNEAKKIFYHLKSTTWQPIETAPKAGAEVLIYVNGHDHPSVGWCDHKDAWWSWDTDRPIKTRDIIGWMPMPEAPNINREEKL